MPKPDEIYRARYFAEIERVKRQLERFATGGMKLHEESPTGNMREITDRYVAELRTHINELELFLTMVKRS